MNANVLTLPFTETGNASSPPLMEESVYRLPDEAATEASSFTNQWGLTGSKAAAERPRRANDYKLNVPSPR